MTSKDTCFPKVYGTCVFEIVHGDICNELCVRQRDLEARISERTGHSTNHIVQRQQNKNFMTGIQISSEAKLETKQVNKNPLNHTRENEYILPALPT